MEEAGEQNVPEQMEQTEQTEQRKNDRKSFGQNGNVHITQEEYEKFRQQFPDYYEEVIQRADEYLGKTAVYYDKHIGLLYKIALNDVQKYTSHTPPAEEEQNSSFDTEEFWQAALQRSYGDIQ